MRLNLQILREDLSDLEWEGAVAGSCFVRPLGFASRAVGGQPAGDRVYVVETGELAGLLEAAPGRLSVLCIGEPRGISEETIADHNVLWTVRAIDPDTLVARVNGLFARYGDWLDETERSFALGKSLRSIAEQSEPIFDNPLWMWDAQLQTVFHVAFPAHYRLPENYQMHEDGTPWPVSEVNAINETFRDSLKLREPYVLPPMFGYDSLCYNIFDQGTYAATLCVDGVNGKPFTDRDKVLIRCLGDRMGYGLKYEPHFSKHATYSVNLEIERLLERQPVPERKLARTLGRMGWHLDDSFFCVVARQDADTSYTGALLMPVAEKVCGEVPGTIFSIAEGAIVFIANLALCDAHPEQVCERVLANLRSADLHMELGVSTPFMGFMDLPCFRDQALEAIDLGKQANSDEAVHMFHDYILDCIVERCTEGTVAETLFPPGFSQLIRYDRDHNGDLVDTLSAYLDNGTSAKRTAEKLYMHRNTLLTRLKRIEEVGRFDLSDAKTRLLLTMAIALRNSEAGRA